MPTIKTSELSGVALDWAVAKASRLNVDALENHLFGTVIKPSSDWSQGGPIIERERVSVRCNHSAIYEDAVRWFATTDSDTTDPDTGEYGASPLVAAMRCYVASRLGDSVEVPEL